MRSMVEGASPLRWRLGVTLAPSAGFADWLPQRGSNYCSGAQ